MNRCFLLVAAALTFTGCGMGRPDSSTPQGQCEAEAWQNPQVKLLTTKSIVNSVETRTSALAQRDQLKDKLVQQCLARQGLAPLGGVERPDP